MTCFFTAFRPRKHVFKNNDSKMTDLRQRGNNVFIVVLVFFTFFFHCEWSSVLHNFELTGIWRVFQNTISRLIFAMADFLVV